MTPECQQARRRRGPRAYAISKLLLLAALCGVQHAKANPVDSFGLGSRAIGMGNALSADVTDFSANYYNPAGLARASRTGFGIGYQHIAPSLTVNGQKSPLTQQDATMFGLVVPGQMLGIPIAFGLGGHLTGDRLSRVVTFADTDQRWAFYDNRPEQIYLSTNVSIRPWPSLSVGAGLSFVASTDGTLSITGSADQPMFGGNSEYDSHLQHEVLADLLGTRYPVAGIQWDVNDRWRLAAAYRGQGKVTLGVDSVINGELVYTPEIKVPLSYILESTTIQSFVPQQFVLGTHFQATKTLGVNLDATWVNWSAYTSPLSALHAQLKVGQLEGLVLSIPDLPEATELQNAGLQDRLVLRGGAEWRYRLSPTLELPIRGGYGYESTPLATGSTPNLLDSSRHILSCGLGLAQVVPALADGQLRFDAHLQWSAFNKSTRPSTEDNAPDLVLGGNIWTFGATLGLDL